MHTSFEWNEIKNKVNIVKHGVSFVIAQKAFRDKNRVIHKDLTHSNFEKRFYCFGKISSRVLTVRFTYRGSIIRIIGAGYWAKGRKIYEKENNIYR